MDTNINGQTFNEFEMAAIKRYLGCIGGGFRHWTPEMRVMMGKLNAPLQWATKRVRYGPSGRRQKSYKDWRISHGKPPVESTFECDNQQSVNPLSD